MTAAEMQRAMDFIAQQQAQSSAKIDAFGGSSEARRGQMDAHRGKYS